MDQVARWSAAERRELFTQAAARLGIGSALVMEKDFWVCWTLKHVVALRGQPRLIFKGGTSLSKVFGLIRRFSASVDTSKPAIHRQRKTGHRAGAQGEGDVARPLLGTQGG